MSVSADINNSDYTDYLYQEIQDEISEFHFHNFTQAAQHYKNQADAGDEQAMFIYAVQLEGGYGVDKDYQEAIKWYQEAAKLGNPKAKYNLGLIYYVERYEGIEGTKQQALQYFIEAANDDFDKACLQLGHLYLIGSIEIEQNIEESIKYYQKAADLENYEAYNCLGNIYKTGRSDGVTVIEQDLLKAKEYYLKGSEGSVLAKYNLGCIYYEGVQQISKDDTEAQLNQQDQEHVLDTSVQPNYQKAYRLFKDAADANVQQAAFNLGSMLESGTGCRKNLKKALEYYGKARDLGYNGADEHYMRVKQQLKKQKKKGGCTVCVIF